MDVKSKLMPNPMKPNAVMAAVVMAEAMEATVAAMAAVMVAMAAMVATAATAAEAVAVVAAVVVVVAEVAAVVAANVEYVLPPQHPLQPFFCLSTGNNPHLIIIRDEASPDAVLTGASLLSPAKWLRKPSRHFIVYM